MHITEKLKVQKLLSALITVIGLVLMTYMIYVESEPGAIPLLFVVVGIGWHVTARARLRSHQQ